MWQPGYGKSKILLCFFRVRTAFLFSGSASTGSVKQNLHRKKWACHETISENTQNADSFHAAAFFVSGDHSGADSCYYCDLYYNAGCPVEYPEGKGLESVKRGSGDL